MPFFAHSGDDGPPTRSDWQLLRDHLLGVAGWARARASVIKIRGHPLAATAYAAGLLHDLGKYRPGFQEMLDGGSVAREKTYHKQAGAAKAEGLRHSALAFAIAGHHGGIPDKVELRHLLRGESGLGALREIWDAAVADCPELAELTPDPPPIDDLLIGEFLTRVLFSCLVDADWSDTAEHERQRKGWPIESPPPRLDARESRDRLGRVLDYTREKAAKCPRPEMARLRDEVLQACLQGAENPPGLYSLTVPTGGGKTLSGLAFALRHAEMHGKRRIIYVSPYLSILDQNAREIRKALASVPGDGLVLEHHSLADPGDGRAGPEGDSECEGPRAARSRLAENWDAPVVLTTSVQFFESLFSNQPGRCRKLHNLAESVVLLDECQTIPPHLLAPTYAMLGQLVKHLGCTLVFCTATQPAFDHPELAKHDAVLNDIREIIPEKLDLFRRLRRVTVRWPKREEVLDWEAVAHRMRSERAALCVVNTRRAARELFNVLRGGLGDTPEVFHLSTWMCPAHRLAILDRVKRRLLKNRRCFLVSTQLIESGVDIDFPFVMREMGPLEAIIQAAGRCNREGLIILADGSPGGRVVVFRSRAAVDEPAKYYPSDLWYKAGRDKVGDDFLNDGREPRVDDPADIREYYRRLFHSGKLDREEIQAHRKGLDFPEVASRYRLIADTGAPVVVATWDTHRDQIAALLELVRWQPIRAHYRELAPFQINCPHKLLNDPSISEVASGIRVWQGPYDPKLGLMINGDDFECVW